MKCVCILVCYIYTMSMSINSCMMCVGVCFFFFQAEDGIRDLVRSRGLGDVYKRQVLLITVPLAVRYGVQYAERPETATIEPTQGTLLLLSLIHI